MDKTGLYSIGQFMGLAHVTKKTLRYYDEHNILKPTYVTQAGARYYSDHDLAKLQQILLLKYLGFSLADIREMTVNADAELMESSLILQKKLIDDKIEQLQIVSKTLEDTTAALKDHQEVDWSNMLDLIHAMGMEQTQKNQYQSASNISARINLHTKYSMNPQSWFSWIYEKCAVKPEMKILEVGCGDGSFWTQNKDQIPENIKITLSDISSGMLRDARRNIGSDDERFSFVSFDCQDIPYKAESFDLVVANHVLFYCDNIAAACKEIQRVLKTGGTFICSTYGENHMKEISKLASGFDDRIVLSATKLYDQFGRENGERILSPYFKEISWEMYPDHLMVTDVDALISYILSCHGNQTQYIVDQYQDFKKYVRRQMGDGFYISKDAGIFISTKDT